MAIYAENWHIVTVLLCLVLDANKLLTTCEAYKVLRVEKIWSRGDVLGSDDLFASAATVAEKLKVVCLAIGLVVLDHEFVLWEGLRAARADKVLWVVSLTESICTLSNDHFTAVGTRRALVDDLTTIRCVCRHLDLFLSRSRSEIVGAEHGTASRTKGGDC